MRHMKRSGHRRILGVGPHSSKRTKKAAHHRGGHRHAMVAFHRNPSNSWGDFAALAGSVIVGNIAAQSVGDWWGMRTIANGGTVSTPMYLGVKTLAGALLLGGGMYADKKKHMTAAAILSGAGLGAIVNVGTDLVRMYIDPALQKALAPASSPAAMT